MRHSSRPFSGDLSSPNCRILRPVITSELVDQLRKLELTPRRNVNLEKLTRFRGQVPKNFPLQYTSFSFPLYIYIKSIYALGQINVARALLGIIHIISSKLGSSNTHPDYQDDYVRMHLKTVSSHYFPSVFNDPANMFFVHLHSCGGKSPYTQEQIVEDITSWISYKPDFPEAAYVSKKLDAFFSLFKIRPTNQSLTFAQFCDDPILWATSGGAPPVEINGSKVRNKWAWAFKNKIGKDNRWNDVDLYHVATQYPNVCQVALKEEPAKTREIITTPMASYLRQSYLAYRWGKPKINSPIGKRTFLQNFQQESFHHYLALDGDRFDQSIPKGFILEFVRRMGQLDPQCQKVAEDELESLRDLKINWRDNEYLWEGGLLSGWRFTSIIGSCVSWIVGQYIIENSGMSALADVAVLGDDIILYGPKPFDKIRCVELYNKFGLTANIQKTASGPVGEFLRRTYSPLGILAYPALALRSIFYASPWLSSQLIDKYTDLTNAWLTFYSRLLPFRINSSIHGTIRNLCKNDLVQAFGHNNLYDAFLSTPISVGGGGCTEWSDFSNWAVVKPIPRDDQLNTPIGSLLNAFGVEPNVSIRRAGTFEKIRHLPDPNLISDLASAPQMLVLPKDKPCTGIIVNWFLDKAASATSIARLLELSLPSGLRVAGKTAILQALLGASQTPSGQTSVQTTPETIQPYSKISKRIILSAQYKKSFPSTRNLALAAFLFNVHNFSDVILPYGSW